MNLVYRALTAVVCATAISSKSLAADLGGNCCADLEERIAALLAELAVKSGNVQAAINPTAHANADNNARLLSVAISNILGSVTSGPLSSGTPVAGQGPMNLGGAEYAPSPKTFSSLRSGQPGVWATTFGTTASFDGNATRSSADADFAGGIAGVQWRASPDILIGAFAGGAQSDFETRSAIEVVDTKYVLGGLYARYEASPIFVDFSATIGWSNSDSTSYLLTNVALPTQQRASGSFDGVFVVPSIEVGTSVPIGYQAELIPSVTIRYLHQHFGGYTLQGQTIALGIGERDLSAMEERVQLALRQVLTPGFEITLSGGAVFYQRLSDGDVRFSILGVTGIDNPLATESETGGFVEAGFRFDLGPAAFLYGNAEHMTTGEINATTGTLGLSVRY